MSPEELFGLFMEARPGVPGKIKYFLSTSSKLSKIKLRIRTKDNSKRKLETSRWKERKFFFVFC